MAAKRKVRRIKGSPKITFKLAAAAAAGLLKRKKAPSKRKGLSPSKRGTRRRVEEQAKIGGGGLSQAISAIGKRRRKSELLGD